MAKERAIFSELVATTQSKAQRYVFFAERQAAKVADIPADTPTRKIAKVGVIGAGTMGGGISMNFLSAGIPVTIVETSKEALDRGVSIMRRNYENTAKKGRMTMAEVEERMGKLSPTLDFNALADADLVIEAVFEDMDLKKSDLRTARHDRQARRDPRLEHLLPRRRRHRGEDQAARRRARHAFLFARQRDAPARDRARREDVEVRARDDHAARAEDRQGSRRRRRRPWLRRQPHAGSAPARGAEAHSRRRDAFGRGPGARRLRPADGPLRDERSCRPRHRLVSGDVKARVDPRHSVRRGPARPEDRRGFLRLRRSAQRQTLGKGRGDHPRLRQVEGNRAAQDQRRRKSSSAASIR